VLNLKGLGTVGGFLIPRLTLETEDSLEEVPQFLEILSQTE